MSASQHPLIPVNRRGFLESSARNAVGVAAGMTVGLSSLAASSDEAALPELQLAVIGVRQRGHLLATELARIPGCRVSLICDVDDAVAHRTAAALATSAPQPAVTADYREVMDHPRINGVVIATPDHWHQRMALAALHAGKDLYIEAPLTHTLGEAETLRAAASASDRIVQVGLHHRSGEHFRSAVEFVRSGQLGEVYLAKAWTVHSRRGIGRGTGQTVPSGVDYSAWLGSAAARPFESNRFHHNWRWFWDYGSGELGNWGVHLLDVARWGLDVELPWQVSAIGGRYHFHDDQETPDTLQVTYGYPGKTLVWEHRQWSSQAPEGRSAGVSFHGVRGTLIVDRGGWKVYGLEDQVGRPTNDAVAAHLQDFVHALRTREAAHCPLRVGEISSALCHLGNTAYRLGRNLFFDPATNRCIRDPQANDLLLTGETSTARA